MADLPNARFNELPPNSVLKPGYLGAVLNTETDVTEGFDFAQLLTSTTTGNFEWLPDPKTYNDGEAVIWQGLWWLAVDDVPINIVPGTDGGTYWQQIGKSPSGFVFWKPGVYSEDTVTVLKDVSIAQDGSDVRAYYLKNTTRPFVSSDFAAELVDDDWGLLFSPGTGGTTTLREVFQYDSDLFTEQAISFAGLINNLSVRKSDALNSINYDIGLDDDPIAYTNYTSLTDVQTWITANGVGNIWWLKINVVYKTGRTEQAQVIFSFQG
jgi:hypothetical protein